MAKKAKKNIAPAESTVYVGPAKPGLATYTVFSCGVLPPHVEKMIEENADIKHLIVPVSRLAQARRDIKVHGNVLNHFAKKI